MHQRGKARQEKHPQNKGDKYSGEGTVREGDELGMMARRWMRRMEKVGAVVKEKE